MEPQESKENLVFDYRTIRGLIGLITLLLPAAVSILATEALDSISWSYYTDARDVFVGALFVVGAFLISYKGHKPDFSPRKTGRFRHWLNRHLKGLTGFLNWLRNNEEDMVSTIGGIAAWVTALCPTSRCTGAGCPDDPVSVIHYINAIVLFSTTVYFCLLAFVKRTSAKSGKGPKIRKTIYYCCGWGIAVILLGLLVVKTAHLSTFDNITFWAETAALGLFGFAWLTASQYLPFITNKAEQQMLF
jgi:hypothetical protein